MQNTYIILGIGTAIILIMVALTMQPQDDSNLNTSQVLNNQSQQAQEGEQNMKNIVEVASDNNDFSTLVTAVKAAGLAETLSGEGPFTVFAPTNDAFAKLPEGTVENLLKDKDKLTQILTYHVVPGKIMAKDVLNLKSAKTVQGGEISIDTNDGVKVDNANIIQTDIEASNGVIHVIDSVIMPN